MRCLRMYLAIATAEKKKKKQQKWRARENEAVVLSYLHVGAQHSYRYILMCANLQCMQKPTHTHTYRSARGSTQINNW